MKKQRDCVGCGKIIFSDSDLCMKCADKYKERVKEIAKRMP